MKLAVFRNMPLDFNPVQYNLTLHVPHDYKMIKLLSERDSFSFGSEQIKRLTELTKYKFKRNC